jgi:predicted TIM-barrel fold metal-dependent hydrolase
MPFSRGKRKASWHRWERDSPFSTGYHLNDLFDACFRIARQLGVPIVLENVKGAQPWVGRAQAHYGSAYVTVDPAAIQGGFFTAIFRGWTWPNS